MEPIHFGNSTAPLFGMYHPPRKGYSSTGYVFCNPLGQEAIRVFRFYREIAIRLGDFGVHALRFDYSGCGDSYGDESDYSLEKWVTDINTAASELRDISGVDQVSLIGVRLGASLAIASSSGMNEIDRIIAIDPISDGRSYVDRQKAAHVAMCRDPDRFTILRKEAESSGDLLGFNLSQVFLDELLQFDLMSVAPRPTARVNVVLSGKNASCVQLREHLSVGRDVAFSETIVEFKPHWDDAAYIEQTLLVPNLVSEVCRIATL